MLIGFSGNQQSQDFHLSESEADSQCIKEAYRKGVLLAFFNVYAPDIVQLPGDPCIGEGGWMDGSDPYRSEFYVMVNRLVLGQSGDIILIEEQAPCGGGPGTSVVGVRSPADISFGKAQDALTDQSDLIRFAFNLTERNT